MRGEKYLLQWNKLTLKTKIFLTFSIVLMMIIILVCTVFYYHNVNEMKVQTQSLSSVLANQFNKTLELYIEDIEQLSTAIYTDPVIQNSLDSSMYSRNMIDEVKIKNDIYYRLFNQTYPRKNIESISLYTLMNDEYVYTKEKGINVNHHVDEIWMEDMDQATERNFLLLPTTSYVRPKDHSKQYVVPFVRNIYHIPQRYKMGSLKILIHTNAFKELLQLKNHDEIEKYMRVLIINHDGSIIYDSQDMYTGSRHIDLDMSIFMESNSIEHIQWDNKKYLYSFKESNYTGWKTTVLVSNDFILEQQYRIIKYILGIGVLSVLLIAVLSYLLANHVTKPLGKIIKKMKRVKQGYLSERIHFVGNVETDLLSSVYNEMLDSINRLIKEVYESKLAENYAKISALQAQINPHFLYNTLNIMKSISRVKGVEEVAEISECLSDLFKYSMKQLRNPVPLAHEIEHLKNYMKIQQYRFGDRIVMKNEISSEVLDALIPKLTIQPLVENAIKHGLSDKKENGLIELKASKSNGLLMIEVKDNGKGMDPASLAYLKRKLSTEYIEQYDLENEGIGLINIQQRIQLLFGKKYVLKISSHENEGTRIQLEIPYITRI